MRRREFIALLGGATITWPLAAHAQPDRVPRIGVLWWFTSAQAEHVTETFRQALREAGYIEGQNIAVEHHFAEGRSDRAAEIAAELVRRPIDVIVAHATPSAHAAKNATQTIPVVLAPVSDPVATGLVASLARPGGNITGVSDMSPDLAAKRLELLREVLPGMTRVGFLGSMRDPNTRTFLRETQAAAETLGLQLQSVLVAGPEQFESAFDTLTQGRAEALIIQPIFTDHRARIVELATRHRLPTISVYRLFPEAGALMSLGPSIPELYRRAAVYVDKILKGAKPGDLPIEQPTTFALAINLKTAKAFGITIPEPVLVRADEVIE